jgi:AraC-like DNA-binding protein
MANVNLGVSLREVGPEAGPALFRLQSPLTQPGGPGRFASWRQLLADVYDVGAEPKEILSFDGSFVAFSSQQFVLTEMTASRVRLRRSVQTIARSRLDNFAIQSVTAGGIAGQMGHKPIKADAGNLLFIDLSQPLDLQASIQDQQTSMVSLWIPRARLLATFRDENALHGLVVQGTSPAGAVIGTSLLSLNQYKESMTCAEMDAIANGIVELTARAIAPMLEKVGLSSATSQLASFVTIRRFIDRNVTSADLNADAIAESFGLSRASLYRLFEPIGGIASYIRKARLNRAYQELTSVEFSERRIGQIAFSLGFRNISAFNRLFHKAYGVSPREARRRVSAGPAVPMPPRDPVGDTPLANMLAQIGLP